MGLLLRPLLSISYSSLVLVLTQAMDCCMMRGSCLNLKLGVVVPCLEGKRITCSFKDENARWKSSAFTLFHPLVPAKGRIDAEEAATELVSAYE